MKSCPLLQHWWFLIVLKTTSKLLNTATEHSFRKYWLSMYPVPGPVNECKHSTHVLCPHETRLVGKPAQPHITTPINTQLQAAIGTGRENMIWDEDV